MRTSLMNEPKEDKCKNELQEKRNSKMAKGSDECIECVYVLIKWT